MTAPGPQQPDEVLLGRPCGTCGGRGGVHTRRCPAAPSARYSQCDATCTTDCGHCKGQGPPAAPFAQPDEMRAKLRYDDQDLANTVRALTQDLEAWWLERAEQDEFTDVDDVTGWLNRQANELETPAQPVRDTGEGRR